MILYIFPFWVTADQKGWGWD